MRRRCWIDLPGSSRKRPKLDGDQINITIETNDNKHASKGADGGNCLKKDSLKDQLRNLEYGNYPGYYKYRNVTAKKVGGENTTESLQHDHRLDHLKKEWFQGKDVLDIGCNRGEITYSVCKLYEPRRIVGLDIDERLINLARKDLNLHIKDLIATGDKLRKDRIERQQEQQQKSQDLTELLYREDPLHFPLSTYLKNGPLSIMSRDTIHEEESTSQTEISSEALSEMSILQSDLHEKFPNNINFLVHDYVLDSDDLVERQVGTYDVIMCLSVTKWIHLNYKDDGLKRFFKRIFNHLKPDGGILILEAQQFKNYGRRKKLSPRIKSNYESIKFKPEQFESYLLSEEVGFKSCEYTGLTNHAHQGFQRPIQVFRKAGVGRHTS